MGVSREELERIVSQAATELFSQKLKEKEYFSFGGWGGNTDGEPDELDFEDEEEVVSEEKEFADFGTSTTERVGNTIEEPIMPTMADLDSDEDEEFVSPEVQETAKVIKFPTREDFYQKCRWKDNEKEDSSFVSVDEAVQQMTAEMEDDVRKQSFLSNCETAVINALNAYNSKACKKYAREAYGSKSTDRHLNSKTMYKKDTALVNGKELQFTRVKEVPSWSVDLQDCLTNDDRARNLDQLRSKITEALYDYYGGFSRMKTVVIRGYQIIINGTCYMPVLSKSMLEKFPYDAADYVRSGCLAPFFDWGYLPKMTKLNLISFDDMGFVMSYVADDLAAGRQFSPVGLFSICKNLSVLEIEGEIVTYPLRSGKDRDSVDNMEADAQRCSRFNRAYDIYSNNVCGVFGSVRKWTVSNLVNYANNRNNKNIFLYTGGILSRSIVSGVAGTAELGARGVGWVAKGVAGVIKNAVSSVFDQDEY